MHERVSCNVDYYNMLLVMASKAADIHSCSVAALIWENLPWV